MYVRLGSGTVKVRSGAERASVSRFVSLDSELRRQCVVEECGSSRQTCSWDVLAWLDVAVDAQSQP